MTEAEKNEIVGLVMTEISSQAVDFDIATEQPQANDLLTAVREVAGRYVGVTLKWDDVARIATELANQAATRAEQALSDTTATKTEVDGMKASVEQTVTDFNALAAEKKAEIEGVYQSDLNELKGDLVKTNDAMSKAISLIVSTKTGYVISFDDCKENNVFDISESGYIITGANLLDFSSRAYKKILNDSGVEVADSNSSYFARMIPVEAGQTIKTNFWFQRLYFYDVNRNFISRTDAAVYTGYKIPSNVYFIQIQYSHADVTSEEFMVNFGNEVLPFSEYKSNTTGEVYDGINVIGSLGGAKARTVSLKKLISGIDNILTNDENTVPTSKAVSEKIASVLPNGIEITESGKILRYSKKDAEKMSFLSISDGAKFVGNNIFDQSTRVIGKIINDNGTEVNDSQSNYFSQFIPVNGMTLKANFKIQRVYLYRSDKTFIRRTYGYNENTVLSFDENVYFIRIQAEVRYITDSMCVVYGDNDTSYTQYYISETEPKTNENISIFSDGVSDVSATISVVGLKAYIPSVKSYPMWEPTDTTNDYSCTPLGQYSQSIPLLTNTLKYQGFLETYFDIYLGDYSDGYSVKREDLGLDSGASATGNYASPIYSYEFKPKYYNKTVLLSAGMNTCEASTYFGLAYFIKALMEHTEEGMLALYNTTRFIVIPVICPSGIAHNPLLYPNSNNVRINKNFEYYGSWERLKDYNGGAYPDSEVETKVLKKWLNKYADSAFWLDCHSDTDVRSSMLHLGTVFCSDSATANLFDASRQKIIDFYKNKGYYSSSDSPILGFSAQVKTTAEYPKTVYAKDVTRIPSAMMEQFMYSTAWGSDGNTNNDSYAIKHYVAMIRYMVLEICKDSAKFIY